MRWESALTNKCTVGYDADLVIELVNSNGKVLYQARDLIAVERSGSRMIDRVFHSPIRTTKRSKRSSLRSPPSANARSSAFYMQVYEVVGIQRPAAGIGREAACSLSGGCAAHRSKDQHEDQQGNQAQKKQLRYR